MLDQFNRFVVTLLGILMALGGIYCVVQAFLLAALPMAGIYYAVLGFGLLWTGWHITGIGTVKPGE